MIQEFWGGGGGAFLTPPPRQPLRLFLMDGVDGGGGSN